MKNYKLNPKDKGKYCIGNGHHKDENGNLIECQCDECDYMIGCIVPENYKEMIKNKTFSDYLLSQLGAEYE